MTEQGSGASPRGVLRVLLAVFMVAAGVGHFVAHDEFLKQVPAWLPGRSLIVWVSGVAEIALGVGLVASPRHRRQHVGWALAVFLAAVFPGNIHQAVAGTDAFNLGTPTARWVRVLFQPALIALALWTTGAWPRGRDFRT